MVLGLGTHFFHWREYFCLRRFSTGFYEEGSLIPGAIVFSVGLFSLENPCCLYYLLSTEQTINNRGQPIVVIKIGILL